MRRLITPIFFACLLLLATAGFSAYGQEQSHYRTLKLESLAEQLAAKGIRLETEGLYPADGLCPGKQVEMAQDIFGRVGFIGLHLFDAGMQQEYASPVYEFVERYFLELLLAGTPDAVAFKLEQDRVELTFNGTPYASGMWDLAGRIAAVTPQSAFALESDAESYTIGWQLPDGTLKMVFPKQYELIVGADKMEMEKGLMEELARAGDLPAVTDTMPVEGMEPAARKGYYIRKGGHYLANEMHSDTYYRDLGNGKAVLVFDAAMPAESLANLFQEGWCGNERRVTLDVKHHCYGNRRTEFTLELPNWVAYCKQHQCDVYFGMEHSDGQTLKGTVIVVNPDLGYTHTLYFECAADLFTRLRPHLDAVLYSYVPTHNIKDLFYDYK